MNINRRATVWIGDLDSEINEDFLMRTFRQLGEPICSAKIIRKATEGQCYGFLEFIEEESAQRVLHRYNGKPIPNTSNKRFKLNHTNYSKDGSSLVKDYSLFVGDLGPEVDDLALFDAFLTRYKTVKLAKVIYDSHGVSKGYGFVHFTNKSEYDASLIEMQNVHIGSKSVRVSTAQTKNRPTTSEPADQQTWQQQYPGYDYSNYYAAWQQYQTQNQYYSQQYGTYAYPYQQYSYTDGSQPAVAGQDSAAVAAQYAESSYDDENAVEEHDVALDIEKINAELWKRNEDLYSAMDDSRWLPINLDPPLMRLK